MTWRNRQILFLNRTGIGSSLPRRSAPEIIKKMGTAVFTQKGTMRYSGNQGESCCIRYSENPDVDECVNMTSQMQRMRRNSM